MVVLEYIRSIGIQAGHDQIYTSIPFQFVCLFLSLPKKKHGSRQGLVVCRPEPRPNARGFAGLVFERPFISEE